MKANFLYSNAEWLWALPALLLFGAALWLLSGQIRRHRLARFISLKTLAPAKNPLRLVEFSLTIAALLFLAVALARPLTGPRPGTAERSGVDLVILLDVSKSMLAEDVPPSRLGAVKQELRQWLKESAGDRISLVPFAGDAFVMAPLTFDYQALDFVLAEVGPRSISAGGSNLSIAIETASELLKRDKDNARVILLISDGENLEGDAVAAARTAYTQDKITILTVGVGTVAGGKVPAEDYSKYDNLPPDKRPAKGFVRNEYGTWVTSRIDERTLRAIASAAGGKYYAFNPGSDTFRTLQNQSLLPLARKTQAQHLEVADYQEWFQLPLVGAFLVLIAGSALCLWRRPGAPRHVGVKIVQPENYSTVKRAS